MVKVYLSDDSYKALKVDPETTTIEELWEMASEKLMLSQASCQVFFIWGVAGPLELLLYTHQTVSQVFHDWSMIEERYNPKEATTIAQTIKSPKVLTRTISRTLSKGKNLSDPEAGAIRLMFRTTSIVPLAEEKKYSDTGAVHLFYIQAVHNVIKSNYPCSVDTAIRLGGIQLQVIVGDRNLQVHKPGYLLETVQTYVPGHLAGKKRPEEWETLLFKEHERHTGKDNHALKLQYLEIVRQWDHYGCTFFKAQNITQKDQHFFQQDFEGKVRIGVNENGVHIIEPTKLKIVTYPWSIVVDWHSQKQTFFLEVEDETRKQEKSVIKMPFSKQKKIPTKEYFFKAKQAELIHDLICDWLEEYYKARQLEEIQSVSKRESRKKKGVSVVIAQ